MITVIKNSGISTSTMAGSLGNLVCGLSSSDLAAIPDADFSYFYIIYFKIILKFSFLLII